MYLKFSEYMQEKKTAENGVFVYMIQKQSKNCHLWPPFLPSETKIGQEQ